MNRLIAKTLFSSALLYLFSPGIGVSTTLVNGGVQISGIPGPDAVILNVASAAMKATLSQANSYYLEHHALAPANRFLQKFEAPSPFISITNNAQGDVILVFSQRTPSSLKGKKIRCAIPSLPDYAKYICISNIDHGGSGQPFFLNSPRNFTPSMTIEASDFGLVYIASTGDVTNMDYSNIQTNINKSSGGSNTSPGTTSSSTTIG